MEGSENLISVYKDSKTEKSLDNGCDKAPFLTGQDTRTMSQHNMTKMQVLNGSTVGFSYISHIKVWKQLSKCQVIAIYV